MSEFLERIKPWVDNLSVIQDPTDRASYLETINARISDGCVVGALESAFGVDATDEEWDMRIWDMRKVQADFKPVLKKLRGLNYFPLLREGLLMGRAADKKMVRDYMTRVAYHETPLGDALKQHSLSEDVLGLDAIRNSLEFGNIVLMVVAGETARHLVHVGIRDGEIVRLSDEGQKVDPKEAEKFGVYIFTPLKEVKVPIRKNIPVMIGGEINPKLKEQHRILTISAEEVGLYEHAAQECKFGIRVGLPGSTFKYEVPGFRTDMKELRVWWANIVSMEERELDVPEAKAIIEIKAQPGEENHEGYIFDLVVDMLRPDWVKGK